MTCRSRTEGYFIKYYLWSFSSFRFKVFDTVSRRSKSRSTVKTDCSLRLTQPDSGPSFHRVSVDDVSVLKAKQAGVRVVRVSDSELTAHKGSCAIRSGAIIINQSINQSERIRLTKVTNVTARPLLQC